MTIRKVDNMKDFISSYLISSGIKDGHLTVDGSEITVPTDFNLNKCRLTTLFGTPHKIVGYFSCEENYLPNLIGGPEYVELQYNCELNMLTSLEGIAQYIGKDLNAENNKLTNLHNIHLHIKHIGSSASFLSNPIKSHVLGLLKIDCLKSVCLQSFNVQAIINRHLVGARDVLDCAEELVEKGLEQYAQF